ncbi:MAG TPA: permease, partial [Thiotrichales bacterium]|nr:permease [Thiotrichales bacterium]
MAFFSNLLELSLDAAPWLVLGLVIGGLMKVLIPTEFLQRHLKGSGSGSVFKAALLGAPLPLCSCGVIPAALGLRKAGASKPATVSFLVSTPETGVDSISISYALLGPFMAVARPIAAIASAITAGLLVGKAEDKNEAASSSGQQNSCCESTSVEKESCCSTETETTDERCSSSSTDSAAHACCGTDTAYKQPESFVQKSWAGIHYAFTKLLDDIIVWLIIGLAFSAAVKTFLPPSFLAEWGSGLPAMLVM